MMRPAILARLRGVQRVGDGWMAFCEGHSDRAKRSLSVKLAEDGRTLLHCFVGCSVEQIVAAVNMTMQDLAPPSANGPARQEVATYDYHDEAGTLLYQVVRYVPKDFRCRRPDGRGGSVWNLDGVRVVPYRLHELAEARRVYIPEGERDCDALAALGLTATTNHGGASKWREAHTQALVAAAVPEVIVLRDNDRPGAAHQEHVARSCAAAGLRVKCVELPGLSPLQEKHGEDVTDWLAAGHAAAELEALADAAPMFGGGRGAPEGTDLPTTATLGVGGGAFLRQSFPAPTPIIEGLLSDEGGGWRGGEEKLGKSIEVLDEAICLAFALPVLGRFTVPTPRRVLLVSEEDSPRRVWRRLRALLRGHGLDPDDPAVQATLDDRLRVSAWEGFRLDDTAMVTRLEATLAECKPEVVYLDVLRKMTAKDLNKADQASAILDMLDDLRRRYGCVFIVVHHYRKAQGFRTGRGSQEIGGSYVLGAWGENSLFFEPIGRKQGPVRVEVQTKDGPPVPAFKLIIEAEGPEHDPVWIRLRAEDDRSGEDADEVIYQAVATLPTEAALAGKPGVPVATIAGAVKRSDKTVRRALKRLVDAGRVLVTGQASKQKDLYGVDGE